MCVGSVRLVRFSEFGRFPDNETHRQPLPAGCAQVVTMEISDCIQEYLMQLTMKHFMKAPVKAPVKAMFDELPQEIRNHIMYVRARKIYKEAMDNARKYGTVERGEYRLIFKASFLKDICRSHGLKVSGTRNELLHRLREHKKTILDRTLSDSFMFWRPLV